jgi:hypothetical protein
MPPKKSVAQRIRQGVVPDASKTLIASFIRPKTPGTDKIIAFIYYRLTEGAFNFYLAPARFRARPGIECTIGRSAGQIGGPNNMYYVPLVNLVSPNNRTGALTVEASAKTELPPGEQSVLQILYLIRFILERYSVVRDDIVTQMLAYEVPDVNKIRVATMFRSLDVIRPSPKIRRMTDFLVLFRP